MTTARTAADLCADAHHSLPLALGWDPPTGLPTLWTARAPLAIHTNKVPNFAHGSALLGLLAAQAQAAVPAWGSAACPDAVTLVDAQVNADPHAWDPLARAGVRVRTVAADPGRAVGALAALADVATARTRGTIPADTPRFLFVNDLYILNAFLRTEHLPGYAAAARSALRIIAANGPAVGVHLVAHTLVGRAYPGAVEWGAGAHMWGTILESDSDEATPDEVEWTIHPARTNPREIHVPDRVPVADLEALAAAPAPGPAEPAHRATADAPGPG